MKKGGGSEFTIIIGPSNAVLVYALHNLENVLGLARFRVFVPKLYKIDTNLQDMWFQQDGATSHTTNVKINFLETKFGERVI